MILIFTEALHSTGLGHIKRCSALAEVLTLNGYEVILLVHTDLSLLENESHLDIRMIDWKKKNLLEKFLNEFSQSVVFVDSYLAGKKVYEVIKKKVLKLICIDDTNRIDYPQDVKILNPGFGGNYLTYNTKQENIYTGIDYVLLRKPFRDNLKIPEVKDIVESLLITVGGDDRLNLIPQLLNLLNSGHYQDVRKEVIIGPNFKNFETIKTVKSEQTTFHQNLTAEQIRDLMLSVDLAITAGGQTTYELAKCKVPMIILQTISNQEGNIRGFKNAGVSSIIKLNQGEDLQRNLSKYLFFYKSVDKRINLRAIYTHLIDNINTQKVYEIENFI